MIALGFILILISTLVTQAALRRQRKINEHQIVVNQSLINAVDAHTNILESLIKVRS